MKSPYLSEFASIHTAVVFREQPPPADIHGNVRALAIRDLVASKPLHWLDLPKVTVPEKHLTNCLLPGDVVIPSRGEYYKAWLFNGADEPVFPIGQINVLRPTSQMMPAYLAWFLNQKPTQAAIALLLTGTSIKALTKASLSRLVIKVPSVETQLRIAELDQTAQKIAAIRHRLNQLDSEEVACMTQHALRHGAQNA